MSNWLSKLWEDPDSAKKAVPEEMPGVTTPKSVPGVTPSSNFNVPSVTSPAASPAADENSNAIPSEYMEFFNKVFTERNIPGPDFFEFFQALSAMDSLAIDESAKFNAAFATLATQGVTKERLIETASEYVKTANTKAVEFEKTVAEKSKEAQAVVTQAEAEARNIQAQLEALQKKYDEAMQVVANAKEAQASYPDKVANFKKALAHFCGAINSRVSKINTHIK